MTRYSEAAIRQQIAQRLPDNDLELITPAVERAVMNDLYDSTPGLKDHDAAKTYLQGDTVIYNGDLWKLTTEEAEGEFVQGDWVRVLKVGNARRKAVVRVLDGTEAASAVPGSRYIVSGTPLHEMWVELNLQNHDIVEFTADGIIVEHPDEGDIVYVDNLNYDALLIEDGARSWELRPIFSRIHNDLMNRGDAGCHNGAAISLTDNYVGNLAGKNVTNVAAFASAVDALSTASTGVPNPQTISYYELTGQVYKQVEILDETNTIERRYRYYSGGSNQDGSIDIMEVHNTKANVFVRVTYYYNLGKLTSSTNEPITSFSI